MTEASTQNQKPDPKPERSPTSPRKRRRRAPTTGAADDCFACQERQTSCDRRRPYCTQCLDQGRDCSGYKTTLTWGLGVASRGKLRGLSLPIAKSNKATGDGDATPESRKRSASTQLTKLGPTRTELQHAPCIQAAGSSNPGSTPGSAKTTTFNFVNMDPTSSVTSPMRPPPSADWRKSEPEAKPQTHQHRPSTKRARRHSLQPLHVPAFDSLRGSTAVPLTASVIGGYCSQDFAPSVQCSPMTSMFPSYQTLSPTYKEPTPHYTLLRDPYEGSYVASHDHAGWNRGSVSSSLTSDQSSRDYCEDDAFYADPVVANTLDDLLSGQQSVSHPPDPLAPMGEGTHTTHTTLHGKPPVHQEQPPGLVPDDCGAHPSLSLVRTLPSISIGKTSSMQFLIDYYEKVISPVIVAFDGPTNPYRTHILSLAVGSETLQHAIAALSASNLRIRRGQDSLSRTKHSISDSTYGNSVRRSAIAHTMMDVGLDQLSQTSPNEPSVEELFHKSASIKALNEQLADPNRRLDDSILATLLMLCLYHICDTGIGKFKTQFAGVKKILAMRDGAAGANTKATNWLTIMFTWFDAMAAAVNNREGQLVGNEAEWSAFNGDRWALENLAGCDGKLFKTIAKLGRLNLLSQNQPVTERPGSHSPPKTQVVPVGPKTQDYYSLNYNRYDGNGWSTVIKDKDHRTNERDPRFQFWTEWAEIRQSLTEWSLGPPSSGPLDSAVNQGDRQDLSHISESFRYSALLYTERLAYPHLPSAHPNFQSLVTQALFHISNVRSDVFLLWPLFITGTECVSEGGRHLIRERCLSIQKDSGFFNNISGLELLERVWRDDATIDGLGIGLGTGMGGGERAGIGSQGLKWRKAMERVDGEYIVV
ncbi:MAG: hypothetical protein LQ343_002352 [Gyalolechia ehrenbergii]|nr:MAG: hypothetical protein LQ343_002352 [Gyalolechia ehrenbergii]